MGPAASWQRALYALGLLPLVLGSSLNQPSGEDEERGFPGQAADGGAGFLSGATTAPPEATMQRIVSPTLGPFQPSPEIKFPEPPSMMPPVYGEAKVPPSSIFGSPDPGIADVLTPPHQYHPKPAPGYEYEPPAFSDHIPPSGGHHHQQQHHHHHLRPLHQGLFDHGGGADKGEDFYLSYDGPEEDDQAYQYLPHPHSPRFPPSHPTPAPSSQDGDANVLGKKSGKAKAWKTLVAALTTLVPIGLFLAALPPNYVAITNSTSARAGKAGDDEDSAEGRRLDEEEYPVLGLMGRLGGLDALGDAQCESRIFCEMSRLGRDSGGNVVQRVLWRVASDAPDMLTEMVGLRRLFKAVRTNSCQAFKCKDSRGDD